MALSIKHPDADRLARELAAKTGETLTEAIITALRERLRREQGRRRGPRLRDEIQAIRQRCAALPLKDLRSPDEVLGYDNQGFPR
jgi:antitoxin VapB